MALPSPSPLFEARNLFHSHPIRERIGCEIDEVFRSLPDPASLSAEQQRGIIARYTAVLEGNFIYWMTAALLAVKSQQAQAIITDNLIEEVRDCHPGMMRRFALAAHAAPDEADATAVYRDLTNVRLFLGRLSAVQSLITMAFFEGFIQRFMVYLADLARRQGSSDMEYTDVHGVCDIGHTEGLFQALEEEMAINPPDLGSDAFEGLALLRTLLETIAGFNSRPAPVKVMAAGN